MKIQSTRVVVPPIRDKYKKGTLGAIATEYLEWVMLRMAAQTHARYRTVLKALIRHVTENGFKEIGPRVLFSYFAAKRREGLLSQTIRLHHQIIRGFFSWCVRLGYIPTNPMESVPASLFPANNTKRPPITPEEYEELKRVSACTEFYLAIVLGWHTGLRLGDVCCLKWQSIDWEQGLIRVVPSKTRSRGAIEVEIPIHPELMELLKARWNARKADEVYVSEPLRYLYQGYGPSGGTQEFAKYRDLAGISKKKTFHCLRHAALERWMNHPKADVFTVMSMSGHRDPKSLERYVRASRDKKREIIGL